MPKPSPDTKKFESYDHVSLLLHFVAHAQTSTGPLHAGMMYQAPSKLPELQGVGPTPVV